MITKDLPLSDKRIFIIEDNVSNRAIMEMLLEQQGAWVGFDRWGKTVITELKKCQPIDIILLDLMFPNGVTGYDIYNEIRANSELSQVPIIAVSASEPSVAILKTKEMGFSGFISKPVDYDKFPKQIAEILNHETNWVED